jgi:RNA polymerase sigma factor (sigma-70 family)
MLDTRTEQSVDPCLNAFLQATDEKTSESLLEKLLLEHEPLVRQILSRNLRCYLAPKGDSPQNQDAEDLFAEVRLRLVERLLSYKNSPCSTTISNFGGYVARLTYYVCNDYLRQRYPQRNSLKNNLRYLLKTNQDFAIWQNSDGWFCGLSEWRDRASIKTDPVQLNQLRNNPDAFIRKIVPDVVIKGRHPTNLLYSIFKSIKGPLEIDELVDIVATCWEIKDHPSLSLDANDNNLSASLNSQPSTINSEVELRAYLQSLWKEIALLPQRQRIALLLNLKSGQGQDIITLFPATQTATIQQIAEILEIPLKKFVELWADLPLEDAAIANLLGVTRQQVINLRKSARHRLQRRMQEWKTNIT